MDVTPATNTTTKNVYDRFVDVLKEIEEFREGKRQLVSIDIISSDVLTDDEKSSISALFARDKP